MLKSLNNQTKLNNLLSIFDNKRYFSYLCTTQWK